MTENGDQWKQIEFILKNDMKKFQNNNIQTIQQITEDIEEIKPATQAVNSQRIPPATHISLISLESLKFEQ